MSLVARLIAAGTPPELIEEVALLVAEKRLAEQAIEQRRANDRERTNRRRKGSDHVTSRDSTGPSVTERDTPSPSFPPNPPNTPTPVCNNKPTRVRAEQGTRLAADFAMPDDWIEWAMKERSWSRKDAEAEGANFVDYWHAKPGKDGRKSDWPATWRNWVRNSRRASVVAFQRGGAPPGSQQTLADVIRARQAQGST